MESVNINRQLLMINKSLLKQILFCHKFNSIMKIFTICEASSLPSSVNSFVYNFYLSLNICLLFLV